MQEPEIRKIVLTVEDVMQEMGVPVEPVIRVGIVTAVIRNPWAGQGFVEDLGPVIQSVAPLLGQAMVPRLIEAMGGADGIEAYGKAGVVGLNGEVEHASALIHTLRFGNVFRTAAEGTSYLSFVNKRGPASTAITVPMTHKTELGKRSHFLTAETSIPDAPGADEILVAIAAASAGRPFARIGDRHQDMAMGAV